MIDQQIESPQPEREISEILEDGRSGAAQPEPGSQWEPGAQSSSDGDRGADNSWSYAAMKEERTKRQAYQKRVQELEAELQTERTVRDFEEQQRYEVPQQTGDDFWSNPEGVLKEHQYRVNLRSSIAEYVSEHGRSALEAYDRAADRARAANDPDLAILGEKMHGAHDPVAVAIEWFNTRGARYMDSPNESGRHTGTVFPSNLATARNVGKRFGPGWSGPQSIDTIFKTSRGG